MSDAIKELLDRAMADVQLPAQLAEDSKRGYYQRQKRRRAAGVAGAVVATSIAGVLVWSAASGSDSAGISTVVPAAPRPTTYRNVSVSCDGVDFTAQQLAQPGGAEKGTSKTSAILRQFLAHNPFEGMGTVPNTNWLLLVDTPTEVAFGHREGPVGVGPVVHMQLRNGRVIEQNEDGCSTVLVEKGHSSQPFWEVVASGRSLDLQWANGQCGSEPPGVFDKRVTRVEVHETKAAVHLLLVTEPNPVAQPYLTRNGKPTGCGGVGIMSHTKITLTAPLGNRTLYDDSQLNPTPVTTTPAPPSPATTTSPAATLASPRVVGISSPIVLTGRAIRLDPAGLPPASTASPQRLLAADKAPFQLAGRGSASDSPNAHTQLFYGAFTSNATSGTLCSGCHAPSLFSRRLAVWIVDRGYAVSTRNPIPVTFYTAVDPASARVLASWTVGG